MVNVITITLIMILIIVALPRGGSSFRCQNESPTVQTDEHNIGRSTADASQPASPLVEPHHIDLPQRRQAATRWQTNTAVCILCVGGSPKLGPATTLAVPSVGRGPIIGRKRHRTHPQRRQNSKICTADDGKPSTASSEIQNLSQHRRLPPPASPESQVSAQQRRLRTPHIRNRTSDHRI